MEPPSSSSQFSCNIQGLQSMLRVVAQYISSDVRQLTSQNLFYDSILSKPLLAKKPLIKNYLQSTVSSAAASTSQQLDLPSTSSSLIEESILQVIQQAHRVLEEVNEDIPQKNQPNGQRKPPAAAASKKQPTELPPRKPLGRYVLKKAPSMQTTYSTAYARSSSSSSRKEQQPTVSQQQRDTSLSKPSHLQKPATKPSTTTINQRGIPPVIPSSSRPSHAALSTTVSSSRLPPQILSQSKQSEQQQSSETSTRYSASDSSRALTTPILSPQLHQNSQRTATTISPTVLQPATKPLFEIFARDPSEIFDQLESHELPRYYMSKKRLLKAGKEYQSQTKYFREKEVKARNSFLCKTTAHFRERSTATLRLLGEYEAAQKKQKQQDTENDFKINENLEYTYIEHPPLPSRDARRISALAQYSRIIATYTSPTSEEVQFLRTTSTFEDCDICDLFRVWYFLKALENNFALIKNLSRQTLRTFTVAVDQAATSQTKWLSITYEESGGKTSSSGGNALWKKAVSVPVLDLIFESKKNAFEIVRKEKKVCSEDCTFIYEISRQQLICGMLTVIHRCLLPSCEGDLKKLIRSSKIDVKALQLQLKTLRALAGIAEFQCKQLHSFFPTSQIQKYFEDIKEEL